VRFKGTMKLVEEHDSIIKIFHFYCACLRCITWCCGIQIDCEMVTMAKQINIFIISHNYPLFSLFMSRATKIYSYSMNPIGNTILPSTVLILYIKSLILIILHICYIVLLTCIFPFPLVTTILPSLCIWTF
jgi:hypothetical protein